MLSSGSEQLVVYQCCMALARERSAADTKPLTASSRKASLIRKVVDAIRRRRLPRAVTQRPSVAGLPR